MKSLLTVAALLAGLAGPAFAEEAAAPPPPQGQAAMSPSQEASAALPQSDPAAAVPMPAAVSVPLESNAAPASKGSGCGRDKTTAYLTN